MAVFMKKLSPPSGFYPGFFEQGGISPAFSNGFV
jgi:hypothetical protein